MRSKSSTTAAYDHKYQGYPWSIKGNAQRLTNECTHITASMRIFTNTYVIYMCVCMRCCTCVMKCKILPNLIPTTLSASGLRPVAGILLGNRKRCRKAVRMQRAASGYVSTSAPTNQPHILAGLWSWFF